jgi:hypothetical protein
MVASRSPQPDSEDAGVGPRPRAVRRDQKSPMPRRHRQRPGPLPVAELRLDRAAVALAQPYADMKPHRWRRSMGGLRGRDQTAWRRAAEGSDDRGGQPALARMEPEHSARYFGHEGERLRLFRREAVEQPGRFNDRTAFQRRRAKVHRDVVEEQQGRRNMSLRCPGVQGPIRASGQPLLIARQKGAQFDQALVAVGNISHGVCIHLMGCRSALSDASLHWHVAGKPGRGQVRNALIPAQCRGSASWNPARCQATHQRRRRSH